MPTTKQLTAYARVLLQKGLNLQKGQTLVINAPVESHDFVALLTKEAYTAGAAQVVCNWRSDDLARLRYEHEDLQYFESLPDWRRDFSLYYYHKKAAFLSLISANPYLMDSIDTHKIFAQQKAQNEALKEYIDGMMASKTTWLVAAVPSAVWAKLLYPDLDEAAAYEALWKQILQSSRADGADALADWDAHLAELKKRRTWMTDQHFTSLHYTNGLGTDLTIGLPAGHIWQGGMEETATTCCSMPTSRRKKSIRPPRQMRSTARSTAPSPWSITATPTTNSHSDLQRRQSHRRCRRNGRRRPEETHRHRRRRLPPRRSSPHPLSFAHFPVGYPLL